VKEVIMKINTQFFLCTVLFCAVGCTGKYGEYNPFSEKTHFDAVFGYPPKALAKFLYLEDSLTVDPAELTLKPKIQSEVNQNY
jgi:hypothetical protein